MSKKGDGEVMVVVTGVTGKENVKYIEPSELFIYLSSVLLTGVHVSVSFPQCTDLEFCKNSSLDRLQLVSAASRLSVNKKLSFYSPNSDTASVRLDIT